MGVAMSAPAVFPDDDDSDDDGWDDWDEENRYDEDYGYDEDYDEYLMLRVDDSLWDD